MIGAASLAVWYLGFWDFIFSTILVLMAGSVGIAYLAGRFAWKGVKRLTSAIRERKQLESDGAPPPVEARDVVVEPVVDVNPTPDPEPQASRRPDYERLDIDEGTTVHDIVRVANRYVDDPVTGGYAQTVIDTLESAKLRRQSILVELDATFQRGSISWDKFSATTTAALDTIARNCVALVNRIQSFDTAGYLRLKKSVERDVDLGANGATGTRAQRLKLQTGFLEQMSQVGEANESLLYELEKLSGEIALLSDSDQTDASEVILDEIRRLVDDAKYYR